MNFSEVGMRLSSIAVILTSLFALSGCATAVIGAATETGVTLAEERSAGTKVDDLSIYTKLNHLFFQNDTNDLMVNVTINVRHARVMLTGNVESQETAERAVMLAWRVEGVQEVINEITVKPGADFFSNANDAIIKKNLESRLLITKDVWVINYSIDIVSGTAYMLGIVHDQAELNRVLNVVRTTQGVRKVISHLQIRTTMPPEPTLDDPQTNSGTYPNSTANPNTADTPYPNSTANPDAVDVSPYPSSSSR